MKTAPAALALLVAAAVAGVPATASAAPAASAAPRLTTPPAGGVAEAPEGHLVVAWEPAGGAAAPGAGTGPGAAAAPPPGVRYQLQTAPEATLGGDLSRARVLDVGPALASLVSGLPGGETRVRVRSVVDGVPGPWSEPGTIRVAYPDLGLVWKLMALGGVTLGALLAAIVTGARRARAAPENAAPENAAPGGSR